MRSHLGLANYAWQYSATTSDYISANPIDEMRTALNEALGPPPAPGYAAGLAQGEPQGNPHSRATQSSDDCLDRLQRLRHFAVLQGGGLRAKKTEYGASTFYLRPAVLGGQVVAELNAVGSWSRGYMYAGSSLMFEDPITKSKRVTNGARAVADLDEESEDNAEEFTGIVVRLIAAVTKRDIDGQKNTTFAIPMTVTASLSLSLKVVARGRKKTLNHIRTDFPPPPKIRIIHRSVP